MPFITAGGADYRVMSRVLREAVIVVLINRAVVVVAWFYRRYVVKVCRITIRLFDYLVRYLILALQTRVEGRHFDKLDKLERLNRLSEGASLAFIFDQ
jgi:hypothetical protein